MQKPNILLVLDYQLAPPGGAQLYVLNLLKRLQEHRKDIVIVHIGRAVYRKDIRQILHRQLPQHYVPIQVETRQLSHSVAKLVLTTFLLLLKLRKKKINIMIEMLQ